MILYRAALCPVDLDPDSGAMFWFIDRETGKDVFYCPFCGIASSSVPLTADWSIRGIFEVAPRGIRMPTEDELSRCPFSVTPVEDSGGLWVKFAEGLHLD